MLYEHGAELVMGGNDHNYERFGKQTPRRVRRPVRGHPPVRGRDGRPLPATRLRTPEPNSEALDNTTFGILRLELMSWGYSWEFVPATPGGFTDTGTTACH